MINNGSCAQLLDITCFKSFWIIEAMNNQGLDNQRTTVLGIIFKFIAHIYVAILVDTTLYVRTMP